MTDKPDSYAGFNEYNPLLDANVSVVRSNKILSLISYSKSLKNDSDLQKAVLKTSHGRRTQAVGILSIDPMIAMDLFISLFRLPLKR